VGRIAAQRVVQRFFYTPASPPAPPPPTRCLGAGSNLFFDPEQFPVTLSPLVIKQATSLQLYCFVQSFLKTEAPPQPIEAGTGELHWEVKKNTQIRTLASLRKVAMVSLVAVQIPSHELIVKAVALGYELLCELMEQHEKSLAEYIQKPILMLTVGKFILIYLYYSHYIVYNT